MQTTLSGQIVENKTLQEYSASLARTQRLAGIGALAASVAHELNNPISIITTACHDLLSQVKEGELDGEALQERLEMIEQSAWRCSRLIQTMRTYTHLDTPQVVRTDLNTIVEDALALVGYQFRQEFNVQIETELAPDLKPVIWERNQITQVLVNLLTNARDALQPQGGRIRVASWSVPDEEAVAFSIHDTGPGIREELLDQIFEPFFTSKPAGEGTGLGLSIAAAIVHQHQGQLTAQNHPDGGAIFKVLLPRRPEGVESERDEDEGARPTVKLQSPISAD